MSGVFQIAWRRNGSIAPVALQKRREERLFAKRGVGPTLMNSLSNEYFTAGVEPFVKERSQFGTEGYQSASGKSPSAKDIAEHTKDFKLINTASQQQLQVQKNGREPRTQNHMLLFLYRAGCLFAHQQKTRKTTQ
jgi:hypothetical protein